ncbi:isopenicillin N synthase family oxygenase [Nakamurella sp. YIM 132087]|uniref:Isopenicillin N synthase family oxygenase n=1 Tax=Nakamurella alba TaxID=2665158 RepID=A0A7K1FQS5_9ACTN|nr:2-oxoglutarate and iron-dependent oxygenase domain-containing protein [Nakamurella alba]MTD16498.1 isopenicillin N synthase family oxygenase [Nakamurella alba]
MTHVPVVDLDRDPDAVGAELDDICAEVGFFQVIGHGVPTAVTDAAWDAAVAFFELPLPDKLAVRPRSPDYPYGYIPMAAESLSQSVGGQSPPDLKEVYNAGPVDAPTSAVCEDEAWVWSPNLWPTGLPELKDSWTVHHRSMLELSGRIMSLFARGLGLDPQYFAHSVDRSASAVRALCYPARTQAPGENQFRAGAHTDYGTLTLLRQDTVGGLQVQTQSGDWADVTPIDGAFVVNIGDLMARWTNDRWRSTLHRVVDPPALPDGSFGRRHSMPFFHNANWDAVVECLPTCLAPGATPKYEPVKAGPHLMTKFRRTAVAG